MGGSGDNEAGWGDFLRGTTQTTNSSSLTVEGSGTTKGGACPETLSKRTKGFAIAAREGPSRGRANGWRRLPRPSSGRNMERWAASYFSVPEDELEKQKELVGKIHRSLCRSFSQDNLARAEKILKNSSHTVSRQGVDAGSRLQASQM